MTHDEKNARFAMLWTACSTVAQAEALTQTSGEDFKKVFEAMTAAFVDAAPSAPVTVARDAGARRGRDEGDQQSRNDVTDAATSSAPSATVTAPAPAASKTYVAAAATARTVGEDAAPSVPHQDSAEVKAVKAASHPFRVPIGSPLHEELQKLIKNVKTVISPTLPIVPVGRTFQHTSLAWCNVIKIFCVRCSEAYEDGEAAFYEEKGVFRALICAAANTFLVHTHKDTMLMFHVLVDKDGKAKARTKNGHAAKAIKSTTTEPRDAVKPASAAPAGDGSEIFRLTATGGNRRLTEIAKAFPQLFMEKWTHASNTDAAMERQTATANVVCDVATAKQLLESEGVSITELYNLTQHAHLHRRAVTVKVLPTASIAQIFDLIRLVQTGGFSSRFRHGVLRLYKIGSDLTGEDLHQLRQADKVVAKVIPDDFIDVQPTKKRAGWSELDFYEGPEDAAAAVAPPTDAAESAAKEKEDDGRQTTGHEHSHMWQECYAGDMAVHYRKHCLVG